MGKKNNVKAREKRAERKAMENHIKEMESLDRIAMEKKMKTGMANVNLANSIDDPLGILPKAFSVYNKNGLDLIFETLRASELDEKLFLWAFKTMEASMKPFYTEAHNNNHNSNISEDTCCSSRNGWRENVKKDEMKEEFSYYLFAKSHQGTPVAFARFKYEMHFDSDVLFCQDVQVERAYRRKGLGSFMMKVLEMLMIKADMLKIICEIFSKDKAVSEFFKKALQFERDETNLLEETVYGESQRETVSRYNLVKKRRMDEEAAKWSPKIITGCQTAECC